jgi:NAD(P)-dependent dehydrogenase (short-subunit alcohol dehydrogenase family)
MNAETISKRIALVTGAGRGIGEAIARCLAKQNRNLILFDINLEELKRVKADLAKTGTEIEIYQVDVSKKVAVTAVVNEVIQKFGGIDILVNNAGITRDNLLAKISEEDWDQVMAVNLKSAFLLSQAVAAKMRERKFGRIVNIASRSWLGNVGQANYAASKGALVSFTRTLALELAKDQITVNAVAPGLIDTEMTRAIPEKVIEKLLRMQPSGKMGRVDDIARAVAFLTDDETTYVNGQILHVDGGKSCGLLSL